MNKRFDILGLHIHQITFKEALEQVMEAGLCHTPSYVCFANVHMIDEAKKDPLFAKNVNDAAFVFPDGKPVSKAMGLLYTIKQERIAGMDFLPALISLANEKKASIFLYGSTEEALKKLGDKIRSAYPFVRIAGAVSPPFRKLNEEENEAYIKMISRSGAHLVFVALGCPRQEKWMASNTSKINAVLLGVGGAFPVMAGVQKRAPRWMQDMSLEWLYRFIQEPRRMFRRYLLTNSRFILRLSVKYIKRH